MNPLPYVLLPHYGGDGTTEAQRGGGTHLLLVEGWGEVSVALMCLGGEGQHACKR